MLDIDKLVISVFDRAENIVGKGENAGYKAFYFGVVETQDCVSKGSFSYITVARAPINAYAFLKFLSPVFHENSF